MLKKNWFLIGIFLTLMLGNFFPRIASTINPGNLTRDVVIVIMFLVTGLTLPTDAIIAGVKQVRLHVFIEAFIFIITPLYFIVTVQLFSRLIPDAAIPGIYALALLPTTVTSCVVFTQVSGGNTVVAMFNAALSNTLGIILTPLLLSLLLAGSELSLPVSSLLGVFRSLTLLMLLPIVTGQIFRRRIITTVQRYKKYFGIFGNISILLILFFVFSEVAENPEFAANLRIMFPVFVYLGASHLFLILLATGGAILLGEPKINWVTIMYVAPQKTLTMGAPMLAIYFADQPAMLAIAIVPLLFYHPYQLLVAGILRGIPQLNGPGLSEQGNGEKSA